MSRFWREGHWRTSRYGVSYWVEGHWVDRYDWSRTSYGPTYIGPNRSSGSTSGSSARIAESWTIPSAKCPVCGASVFFYQNEHGSRVFFDSLGPPWPKHGCTHGTDEGGFRQRRNGLVTALGSRQGADHSAGHDIVALEDAPKSADSEPGRDVWQAVKVSKIRIRDSVCFVEATQLERYIEAKVKFSVPEDDFMLKDGDLFFLSGERISYFDVGKLEPVELAISIGSRPSKAGSRRKRRKRARRRRK